MYQVAVEGSTMIWHQHANQLRVRAMMLPDSNNNNSSSASTTNTAEPPILQRSTRIRKPRIPWSPSN